MLGPSAGSDHPSHPSVIEVRFQRGLYLPESDLWLDPWDAQPWAFVSHAHADHFARHEMALCSQATASLVRARYNVAESRLNGVPFHSSVERNGHRLRLLPAGHIAGSAMLHVTRIADGATLLYTGDFKVRKGRTSEPVVFQQADTLILETTFALPQFAFPSQMEVEMAVLRFVHDTLADGEVPTPPRLAPLAERADQVSAALRAWVGVHAMFPASVAAYVKRLEALTPLAPAR